MPSPRLRNRQLKSSKNLVSPNLVRNLCRNLVRNLGRNLVRNHGREIPYLLRVAEDVELLCVAEEGLLVELLVQPTLFGVPRVVQALARVQ